MRNEHASDGDGGGGGDVGGVGGVGGGGGGGVGGGYYVGGFQQPEGQEHTEVTIFPFCSLSLVKMFYFCSLFLGC
jgi:hypothetical protein